MAYIKFSIRARELLRGRVRIIKQGVLDMIPWS